MRLTISILIASISSLPAFAQATPDPALSADQKGYVAYHQCMMHAAIEASHTSVAAADIYGIAKKQCAGVRAAVVRGQEGNRAFLAALDAADADKAENFPKWIEGVRERRREFEAGAVPAPPKPN